ncbi:MAG TPA: PAS domain-containing protein [Candidatus Bathyarchaeia archaeon]|nr:PAS domain-containing protein [Candidatus Bathyarchaeia archaeon]
MSHEHEGVIEETKKQFGVILKESKQGIYVYLDDTHKLCNEKFASMLGYASAEEWSKVNKPFTEAFVEGTHSQHTLVSAYKEAIESKTGSYLEITWKTKTGGKVNAKVILVPVSVKGELLALHFITKA